MSASVPYSSPRFSAAAFWMGAMLSAVTMSIKKSQGSVVVNTMVWSSGGLHAHLIKVHLAGEERLGVEDGEIAVGNGGGRLGADGPLDGVHHVVHGDAAAVLPLGVGAQG